MTLFKFTFPMKDFPICVSMALIHISTSLSSFLHVEGCGAISRAAALFRALPSLSLRRLEVLTQLSESPRSISVLTVRSSRL